MSNMSCDCESCLYRDQMETYEVITTLGKGACGAVYLVRHNKTKRLYAQKEIQLDENRKTRTKAAVQREAEILRDLKHPYIVAYQDSFFDLKEESLFIIQDYCDGGTLDDKIKSAKQFFDERQIIQWLIQITLAVHYMHSKKILHRDLKSQNVFLTKQKSICKLGDFGIAKVMEQTIDMASTLCGTPNTLSPEMINDIPYSSKADIWALGCILVEMCALKPAFDANNLISIFKKIVDGNFEQIPDSFSQELRNVANCILVKNPDDRPSAKAILNLPHIREHLDEFLEESQCLLEEKNAKEAEKKSPYTRSVSCHVKEPIGGPDNYQNIPIASDTFSVTVRDNGDSSPCQNLFPNDLARGASPENDSKSRSWLHRKVIEKRERLSVEPDQDSEISHSPGVEYGDDFEEDDDDIKPHLASTDVVREDDEIPEDIADCESPENSVLEEEIVLEDVEDYDDDFEEYDPNDDIAVVLAQARDLDEDDVDAVEDMLMDSEPAAFLGNIRNYLMMNRISLDVDSLTPAT